MMTQFTHEPMRLDWLITHHMWGGQTVSRKWSDSGSLSIQCKKKKEAKNPHEMILLLYIKLKSRKERSLTIVSEDAHVFLLH